MSSLFILLFALISVSNATLSCNGIKYIMSGITTVVPTDVCYSTQSTVNAVSFVYQCINGEIYYNQYTNGNCAGTAVSTAASTAYASATSLEQTCNLGACNYIKVRKYPAVWTDCSQSAPTDLNTYTEEVFIQNDCKDSLGVYSNAWSCSSDTSQVTHSYYTGNGVCTGTATTATVNTEEVACDNAQTGSAGNPVYVTCGTASFNTNTNAVPTGSPTPMPVATLSQCSDSQLMCKGVEWDIAGVTFAYPMDVCYSVESMVNGQRIAASYWYKCKNGIPYIATYNVADCKGDAAANVLMQKTYVAANYMAACCELDPCDYVVENTYSSVDLDCSDPDTVDLTAYTGIPYIDDYCNSVGSVASFKWNCDGGEAKKEYFYGNSDCDGNATVTLFDTSVAVSCDDTAGQVAAQVAIGLECGTASFTGSTNNDNNNNNNNNNNNGATTTTATATTTTATATTTTTCTGTGCVNNVSKGCINNVYVWFYGMMLVGIWVF